jgi:hypothetical protein
MTTFNWTIATLEYDLQPSDMDGAVIVAHWRVNAEQVDDVITHTLLLLTALADSAQTHQHRAMYPTPT